MKKIIQRGLMLLLSLTMLVTSAFAGDWPQFLGQPQSPGVSDGRSATVGTDLVLRWEKNTGSTWNDVPGTPIVVGFCLLLQLSVSAEAGFGHW